MPIIGSTIHKSHLEKFSDDSIITVQKNFFGNDESFVVLEGHISRGLYAIRAYLFPETVRKEKNKALGFIASEISELYNVTSDKLRNGDLTVSIAKALIHLANKKSLDEKSKEDMEGFKKITSWEENLTSKYNNFPTLSRKPVTNPGKTIRLLNPKNNKTPLKKISGDPLNLLTEI